MNVSLQAKLGFLLFPGKVLDSFHPEALTDLGGMSCQLTKIFFSLKLLYNEVAHVSAIGLLLTVSLLDPGLSFFENTVDSDKLASDEAI